MIRLTVLYNLQPDVDEAQFLQWRLGEHQQENMASPGVIRSDFGLVQLDAMREAPPAYRFMTTADWPDMESFRAAFYAPEMQEGLKESLKMLKDPLFLVSEILVQEAN